jgi:hypothetical protein
VEGHLIDAVFHRGNAGCRRVLGAFTLLANCFTSVFSQLSLASQSAALWNIGG